MATTYPLKSGQFISGWESVSFHLDGGSALIGVIQDFSIKMSQTGNDQVFGSSDDGIAIGRKKGKLAVSGAFTCLESFFHVIVEKYKALGLMNTPLNFTVNHKEPDGAVVPYQIINVNIGEVSQALKMADTNIVSITFTAQDARIKGTSLVGKK